MNKLNLYTKINKLFNNDFFTKLENFIFDSDFDTFKNDCFKRKEQNSNEVKIPDIINPNYSSLNIYTFEDFLACFNSNKIFQYYIEMNVLQIKYLLCNYFTYQEIPNEEFSIKLSDKIIKDFYRFETDKLLNSELENLYNDYYDNNPFIKFKDKTDINDVKTSIILFILDYTLNYIKEIVQNLQSDIQNLMDVYRLDTRYKLNCNEWNADNQLSKELNEKRKQLRCAKYNKSIGRKIKNHGKINSVDIDELKQHIEIAKEIITKHKSEIKKICKLDSFKAKPAFEDYIKELDYETQILLNIYFEENYGFKNSASVEFCAYKAMNDKFALDFYTEYSADDNNSYEAMKKFVSRYKQEDTQYLDNLYDDDFEKFILNLSIITFDKHLALHAINQILGQN